MSCRKGLTREEWTKAVKCRLGTNEFEILDCKEMMLGSDGGNLGEYRLVDITVRLQENGQSTCVLHFFYKTEPSDSPGQKEIVDRLCCFRKEVDFFDKLFRDLRSALKINGDDMEWTCKCFYTRPDIIVLENMSVQGYIIVDKLGFDHCAVVLKALANLHAASLIFEESRATKPYRLDSDYADILEERFFIFEPDHPSVGWLKTGTKTIGTLIQVIRGEKYFEKIKEKLEKALESSFKMQKPSKRFRNVVNQGDLWRTNLFFRFNEGKPTEARLIDFQLGRYAPPASDIMCFFYLSTDRALRDQYMPQLLALYYDHLSQNLKLHDLDPESVISKREFAESCDYYRVLGLLVVSLYCTVIYHKKENLSHVTASSEAFKRFWSEDRTKETLHSFKTDASFRDKVTETVEELIEKCVDKEFNVFE